MSGALLLSLVGLALLDGTSVGTLFIPVWLMLTPGRLRAGRVLVYLTTVMLAYFAIGLVITLGAGPAAAAVGGALDSQAALWVQLAAGVGLFALSFRFDPKRRGGRDGASRWRERAAAGSASAASLAGLALVAVPAEVATMLPYLGAIAMMSTSGLAVAAMVPLLSAYCLVMVAPAGLLLLARVAAAHRVEPVLRRVDGWIAARAAGVMGWVLAIAGFLIARDAAARLWFTHFG
ncbi:GAP family protein [Microbispora sp. NPDC046933]|uniref:GAP family protein n=1 Tax=Microbispora sp. NPDC046933 TaxID=3155618 RepID=UPI0033CEC29D